MTTVIKGQPASTEIRAALAAEGKPVILGFSRGKDSIATWCALQESGIEVVPVHFYRVPGIRFEEESLTYFEQHFHRHIIRLPHPALYRWLNTHMFQPPERARITEAANLPSPSYEDIIGMVREDIGEPTAWFADGVRAADSIQRRASLTRHGVMKPSTRKCHPISDWLKGEVLGKIREHRLKLPVDYEWFGRSFDGLDYRFLEPLSRFAPDDYRTVLDWFPVVELELDRDPKGWGDK